MKQEDGKKLMQAMRQVFEGKIYVSDKISAGILETLSGRRPGGERSPMETPADHELEIFQLIGQGKGTRDIADALHLSVKTIDVHRANIKAKLKLVSASEFVRYAVRWSESQGMNPGH